MKKPDPKIADWIESLGGLPAAAETMEKALPGLRLLRSQISQQAILRELDSVTRLATDAMSAEAFLDAVGRLRAARLVKSAAVVAKLAMERLATLPFDQVLAALPSVSLIESYRKVAKVGESVAKEHFLAASSLGSCEVGSEWLMAHVTPDELWPLFRHLLTESQARGSGRESAEKALWGYLAKDPKGERLTSMLALAGSQGSLLSSLAGCIRASDAALAAVVENIGVAARDARCAVGMGDLLRLLFVDLLESAGARRRTACARIARVGTALLLSPPDSTAAAAGLAVVRELAAQLRNLTRDSEVKALTWVLVPLDEGSGDETEYLSSAGARRWALAWEDAERAGEPLGRLEMLGYNLGMRPIVEVGEQASYSPAVHEDIAGGLLPGATVVAVSSGWSFHGRPVIRAKVRRKE